MKSIRSWCKFKKLNSRSKPHDQLQVAAQGDAKIDAATRKNIGQTYVSSTLGTPTIYSAAKAGMGLMKEISTSFAPLEGVIRGLVYILDHHEKWEGNKEGIKRLVARVEALRLAFEKQEEIRYTEEQRRTALLGKLGRIAEAIDVIQNKYGISSYIAAADDAKALSAFIDDIRDILTDYQVLAQMEMNKQIADLMTAEESKMLLALPHASNASHLSEMHQYCLKGTRKTILDELEAWAENRTSRSVFWLSGHAGSGKSTIAQSFCQLAFATGRLGASFFCSRDYADRSDLGMIFPTLAFELARRFPTFKECILRAIKERPDVGHVSLTIQLMELLIEPLERSGISTIIAVDALDECKDPHPTSALLSLLATHIHRIPSVKFFFTSRPEHPIRSGFRLRLLRPKTKIFVLYEISKASVDADIRLFLKTRLSEAVENRSDIDLPFRWPTDDDIENLTKKFGQLFIFAATAVTFVTSAVDQPNERLRLLKAMPEKVTGIDYLYRTVLSNSYPETIPDPDYHMMWSLVVGTVVLAYRPFSRIDLCQLFLFWPGRIASLLRPLHSILNVPEDSDKPIAVYHKSFRDFVTDPARCPDSRFFIDPATYHAVLVKACVSTMNGRLESRILFGFSSSAGLSMMECKHLFNPATAYSCLFWTTHLDNIPLSSLSATLLSSIATFLSRKLYFWFDALVFLGSPNILQAAQSIRAHIDRLHKLTSHLPRSESHRFAETVKNIYHDYEIWTMDFKMQRKSGSYFPRNELSWADTGANDDRYEDEVISYALNSPER
ncbi:hypothetical protein Hypma_011296 [Hypsizygus marmoreus]|uniref:Nephrocystin 3-like N-terminal domain-containing protein n=1 Tax=Hypsizygus marmoreus TaxID=39966 RepID=A0A369JHN8_HYPMA|nr:hypothetical protein Hypma_011296 [Hypsizygus marmoreus]